MGRAPGQGREGRGPGSGQEGREEEGVGGGGGDSEAQGGENGSCGARSRELPSSQSRGGVAESGFWDPFPPRSWLRLRLSGAAASLRHLARLSTRQPRREMGLRPRSLAPPPPAL